MKPWHWIGSVAITVSIGTLASFQASAQLYRCGSAYQDRPCDSGQSQTVGARGGERGNAATPSAAAARANNHPACTQRGNDAQKIVWEREAGSTLEKQLESESNPERRKLINSVYNTRGNVATIRARIEADCMSELEEKTKALALYQSMVKAGAIPAAQSSPAPNPAEQKAAAERQAQLQAQEAAQAKQKRCSGINSSIELIRAEQRSGASAARMNTLNEQLRQSQRQWQDEACA